MPIRSSSPRGMPGACGSRWRSAGPGPAPPGPYRRSNTDPCIGIAIDGVGYGDDGTVWGGEVFAGQVPDYERVAHLEVVPMPGETLPQHFLSGCSTQSLPGSTVRISSHPVDGPISSRCPRRTTGKRPECSPDEQHREGPGCRRHFPGICREKTYDGEPAMKLESAAVSGRSHGLGYLVSPGRIGRSTLTRGP